MEIKQILSLGREQYLVWETTTCQAYGIDIERYTENFDRYDMFKNIKKSQNSKKRFHS